MKSVHASPLRDEPHCLRYHPRDRLSSSKLMSNYISGVMPFSLTSSYFFLDDYFVLVRKFYGCIVLHCVVLSKFL